MHRCDQSSFGSFLGFFFVLCVDAFAVDESTAPVRSFLTEHCVGCHMGETRRGGLDLDQLKDFHSTKTELDDPEILHRWVQIYDRVASGEMPPKSERPPERAVTETFLEQLAAVLTPADFRQRRSALRRLNRVEYENTVCDLFGIRVSVKELLPEDPTAYGFDTVGEALGISSEQLELYLLTANLVIGQVFGSDRAPPQVSVRMPFGKDEFAARGVDRYFLKTNDDSLILFFGGNPIFLSGRAKADGTYRVRIQAKTHQSTKPIVLAVHGGDVIVGRGPQHLVGYYDIKAGDEWTITTFEDYLEKGACYKMIPYGLRTPTTGPNRFKGPGLMIGEVSVEGPLEVWPPLSREQLLGKIDVKSAGMAEARQVFARLLPQAFRRSISPDEIEPYLALTKSALDARRPFLDAVSVGLKAVLCSPAFLMREEMISPDNPVEIAVHSLASRMSYFLWSSMPDSELTDLANSGQLAQPNVLHQQVERMLLDPKSERFIENFTGQWLGLRQIDFTEPDARLYPEFDEMLRYSMVEETRRFFREILEQNEPLLDFVDSTWTILNERLAIHYEIPRVTGQNFRRVDIPKGNVRGGVITQASVLKIAANGTTTSPVVRGNWVLSNIVGIPSPPPPSNIPGIDPDIRGATSIREKLAKHRNIESCAACHNRIDPPGFALESFDPIGGWRKSYRTLGAGMPENLEINGQRVKFKQGANIDPSGQLIDGTKFADVRGFKKLLRRDEEQIAKCLTEKLLIYSLGRPLGFSDRPAVQSIVENVAKQKYGFRSLIDEVVLSKVFHEK